MTQGMPGWVRNLTIAVTIVIILGAVLFLGLGCYFLLLHWRPRSAGILMGLGVFLALMSIVLLFSLRHRNSPRGRIIVSRLLLLSISTLISLGLAEAMLATLRPALTLNRAKEMSPGMFRQSTILPIELKPGYSNLTYILEADATRSITINSHGFRNEDFAWEKPDSTFRMLLLGDSFAFNGAVDDGQVHTAVLQKMLNAQTDRSLRYEVINSGYANGYSPDAYVAFMLHRGFDLEPDLVMMQYFVLNDFKDLLENKIVETRDGLPYRVRSEYRLVDDNGQHRSKVSLKHKLPALRNSHLYITIYEMLKFDRVMLDLASVFVPGYNAHNFAYNNMGIEERHTYLEADARPAVYQQAFEQSIEYIVGLDRECKRRGVEFVLFLVPTGIQVDKSVCPVEFLDQWSDPNPQKQIIAALQDHDIRIFNPLEFYRDALEDQPFYLGQDRNGHWSVEGNRITGEAMYDYLVSDPPIR